MNTKDVLRNLSYGVYVVSAKNNEKSTGCIANSIMQVTYDTVVISLNHNNYTNECIKKNHRCAVSILATDVSDDIIPTFGFQSGRDVDKFQNIEKENIDGIDIIKNSIGYLILDVINEMETETHTLFLAKIVNGDMLSKDKTVMTYAYYHMVKNGTTPKNAPTYVEEKASDGISYKCSVCGYVYKGDIEKENADFVCPICKQPKSVFQKM